KRIQHLDLQIGVRARRPREMAAQRAHDAAQVALAVLPRVLQVEAAGDGAQRAAQTLAQRVIAAEGRRLALEVLGRHRRAPEDELVVVVAPVQHLAGDRVVEGLGALGLGVLVQQADVGQLDRRPQRFVARRVREGGEEVVYRLLHAQVVHLDATAREAAHFGPVGALIERLRPLRRFAEQAVVLVEARADRARYLQRRAGAALDPIYTAASFAFFFSSKNCSSSVEPCSAVVEALPPVTTWVSSSKYPVPTSRWCLTAVKPFSAAANSFCCSSTNAVMLSRA